MLLVVMGTSTCFAESSCACMHLFAAIRLCPFHWQCIDLRLCLLFLMTSTVEQVLQPERLDIY